MEIMQQDKQQLLLESLLRIGHELNSHHSRGEILGTILLSVMETLGAQRGFIVILNDSGEIEVKAQHQIDPQEVISLSEISRGALDKAIQEGVAVLTEDARQDPRFSGSQSIMMHDIRSISVVPLKQGAETIGALYMDSRLGENAFSEQSLDALSLFGALAALSIEQAEEFSRLEEENLRLRRQAGKYSFQGIIGQSKAMELVFTLMERVIPTDLPVLLQGESGTGKELIARAIHNSSPRSDHPFLAIFAGNLGENLLESELFGHVKGAFTGAHRSKDGLLLMANGGTLLLDEVSDIPPRVQAKLLRVLQDGKFKPVGGMTELYSDVRIISATHQDLAKAVADGTFREDLYYRINGIEIQLPPLRKRREDIPLIAEKVLRDYAVEMGREKIRFSRKALAVLTNARWPGNVRELERTVQRAVVLCPGKLIEPEHLVFTRTADGSEGPEDLSLKAAEKMHILNVLERCGGNRSEAARLLAVSRRYLQNLIKEWREEGLTI